MWSVFKVNSSPRYSPGSTQPASNPLTLKAPRPLPFDSAILTSPSPHSPESGSTSSGSECTGENRLDEACSKLHRPRGWCRRCEPCHHVCGRLASMSDNYHDTPKLFCAVNRSRNASPKAMLRGQRDNPAHSTGLLRTPYHRVASNGAPLQSCTRIGGRRLDVHVVVVVSCMIVIPLRSVSTGRTR